jgi:phosphatidylglycerol:prolipoprotein diacylglycerol transferase
VWGIFQIVAVLAAFAWFARRAQDNRGKLCACLAIAFAGAAAGAVLLGLAAKLPEWVRSGFDLRVFARAGIMAYGALAGLALTFAISVRLWGLRALPALDRLAPCLGVMVLLARLGCFFGGCDFGAVTSAPWGVRFPPESPAFQRHVEDGLILASDRASLAVHPTQLYEAAAGLAMIVVALAVERARPRAFGAGAAFAAAASTYAALRFAIEALRGDTPRGASGPLTMSQWWSALILAGGALWAWSRRGAPGGGDYLQQRKPVE